MIRSTAISRSNAPRVIVSLRKKCNCDSPSLDFDAVGDLELRQGFADRGRKVRARADNLGTRGHGQGVHRHVFGQWVEAQHLAETLEKRIIGIGDTDEDTGRTLAQR